MGIADISSSHRKLRRADEHLNALEREFAITSGQRTHPLRIEFKQEGAWQVIYLTAHVVPPPEWAMMIGDAINNTRAALDHLIWQLVLRDDSEPRDTHAFPIFADRQESIYKVKARPKKTEERSPLYGIVVDGDAWTIVEDAQPFNRATPELAKYDYLANLAQFTNLDKHWGLLSQAPFPNPAQLTMWVGWRDYLEPVERIDRTGPLILESPAEVCRLRFAVSDPGMYVKGHPVLQPTFGSGQAQASFGRFREIHKTVAGIVNQISRLPRVKWDS